MEGGRRQRLAHELSRNIAIYRSLEHRFLQLSQIRQLLAKDTDVLARNANGHRVLLAPIHRLPNELLIHIFEEYVLLDGCYAELLLAVCRRWNNAARAPRLWAFIRLPLPFRFNLSTFNLPKQPSTRFPVDLLRNQEWQHFLTKRIKCSNDLPLFVEICALQRSDDLITSTALLKDVISWMGAPAWKRCHSLKITGPICLYQPYLQELLRGTEFSQLRTLELSNLHSLRGSLFVLQHSKLLKELKLQNTEVNICAQSGIRHLDIDILNLNRWKILTVAAPQLRTLVLNRSATPHLFDARYFDFETPIPLPCLETLTVGDDPYIHSLLSCFAMPALKSLKIKDWSVPLWSALVRHMKTVKVLHLQFQLQPVLASVIDLLHAAKDLEQMRITDQNDEGLAEELDRDSSLCPRLWLLDAAGDYTRSIRVSRSMRLHDEFGCLLENDALYSSSRDIVDSDGGEIEYEDIEASPPRPRSKGYI